MSLEIGTGWGSWSVQIGGGNIDSTKPDGRVISIDKAEFVYGTSKHKIGKFIPQTLNVELVRANAIDYLLEDNNHYELIYEDSEHTTGYTKRLYELAVPRLVDGGVIISHDACHPKFNGSVVSGINGAGYSPEIYLVDGDNCGLSIYQKRNQHYEMIDKAPEEMIADHVPSALAEIAPTKPKRKRRNKKRKLVTE